MKVCVIGAGFVGLVTSVYFADLGHKVICVDKDRKRVNRIKQGKPDFYEPFLEEKLQKVLGFNFEITNDLKTAADKCDFIFLCVGTPSLINGEIDLSYVKLVSDELASIIKTSRKFKTVIVKSTVVPGTCRKLVVHNIEKLSGKTASRDFSVTMNPEFLREGSAVKDAFNPDRVIVGSDNRKVGKSVLDLYINVKDSLKIQVSLESAELSKYLSNMFFANLISFSNEFSRICQSIPNIEMQKIFNALFKDRRFQMKIDKTGDHKSAITEYIWPGVGFGGSCFPKDLKAIINFCYENKIETSLLNAVKSVNDSQTAYLVEAFLQKHKFTKIAILGLSFKPDTDDVRESKSLDIIEILNKKSINVIAHDPLVKKIPEYYKCDITTTLEDTIKKCDGVIIATSWKEYTTQNMINLLNKNELPILDCRLLLVAQKEKFKYYYGPGIF